MKISDFVLYKKYSIYDLVEAFENGAFHYGQGMVYCSKSNILVLTSKYTKDRVYQDKIEHDIIHYTGMGQVGDQQNAFGNKRLINAKRDNTTVYMFLVYKDGEYRFYGRVSLDNPYYFDNEPDKNGDMRKVYKFPLTFIDAKVMPLSEEQMRTTIGAGSVPIINVVGAAIKDGDKYLVAQRSVRQGLAGKWEFPGGKIEKGETPEQALAREIKEELKLSVKVGKLIDTSNRYNGNKNKIFNLAVYECSIVDDNEAIPQEEQIVEWKNVEELENLDWADNDIPIVQTIIDAIPKKIVGEIDFSYKEGKKRRPRPSDIKRECQDYEKSQKKKAKSGEEAELAVINYERERLNQLGRPDLAASIEQVSKTSNDYGYDILSYDLIDGHLDEKHIEVKSATLSGNKIEFFISQAELRNYAEDDNYFIYSLLRFGRNYKLHVIKKEEFLSDGRYLSPITYKVSIPVEEF